MAPLDSHLQDFETNRADNDYHPTTTHRPSYPKQFTLYSRPLIDSARNEWQLRAAADSQRASSSSADDIKSPGWSQMALSVVSAPRFRHVLIYVALFLFAFIGWRMLVSPRLQEQKSLLHSLDPTSETETGGWFGTNSNPQFDGLIQIRTLDPNLVPGNIAGVVSGKSSRKRLIIVGDVHGCKDECKTYPPSAGIPETDKPTTVVQLLEKVSFNQAGGDHLIFVGDMINKGPNSPGVVDLARQHSASGVRGNHEDRVLLLRHEMVNTETLATPDDDEDARFSSKELGERAVARSLSDEQAQWLENCSVILNVGQVPGMGQVVVVHAGLVPGIELEKQDPSSVMTMRTIDLDTHVPSPKKNGMNWAKVCLLFLFHFFSLVVILTYLQSRCLISINQNYTRASSLLLKIPLQAP